MPFHYAKLTGQRSVSIPEENAPTFSEGKELVCQRWNAANFGRNMWTTGIIGKQKITDLSKVGTHFLEAFNAKQRKSDLDLKVIETWGFLNCVLRS